MTIKIKENEFVNLLKYINDHDFHIDGCACGDFVYKLDDRLFLTVYRSCRKSNNTPNHKLWEIHGIQFYDNVEEVYEEFTDGSGKYLECYEFHKELKNIKLNEEQKEIIIDNLKRKTAEYWGSEYR